MNRGETPQEETHEDSYLVLLTDGTLTYAWRHEETTVHWGSNVVRPGVLHSEKTHSAQPASDAHMQALDFERYYRDQRESRGSAKFHYWGDRDPSRKLLRHAKAWVSTWRSRKSSNVARRRDGEARLHC